MKVFINNLKSLPVAVSGLALGVAGLGNILGSEIYVGFRYFCATITLFILLLVLIKNLHHPKTLWSELTHPVSGEYVMNFVCSRF